MFWILIICFLITLLIWRRMRQRRQNELAGIPTTKLKSYPIFGHILNWLGNSTKRMRAFEALGRDAIENGGICKMWYPGQIIICVADPEVVDTIANTCLEKHEYILSIMRLLLGDASIFAPVSIWRPRRKLMAATFSMKNLMLYTDTFSRKSLIMADLLKKEVGKGTFSFWEYISPFTLDSVCETSLGILINSQESSSTHEILVAIKNICEIGGKILCKPWLPYNLIPRWLPDLKRADKLKKLISDFAIQIIQEKRKSLLHNSDLSSQKERASYLDHVLQNYDCISDKLLLEETLLLMVAGNDTSGVGAAFTVLLLSKHLNIQDKVHKELDEVLGNTKRPVTYQDLHHLKYLEAVIKESLRLYPPVPVVIREIERDISLSSGLTLVEGCAALINIWAINRNPEYWGPDADEFRPERFLDAPLKHPAAFASFSYGVRGCVGMQYAMLSLKTNLATMLHRYRVLPAIDNSGEIKTKFEIMMKDVDNFNVKIENRNRYIPNYFFLFLLGLEEIVISDNTANCNTFLHTY